jgi:tRNA pseudouridine55 synthase
LDPLATGLLVLAVGPATRFLQYLPLEPKEYIADIQFGRETSTYDLEGEVVSEQPVPTDLTAKIEEVAPQFHGLIQQYPPMYSAVKVDGQPLYKYARAGKDVERSLRTVHIQVLEIEVSSAQSARARVVCSGGTYIRTLAHDLGNAIGCGAHLSGLIRTRVGRFSIEQSVKLDDITPANLIPLRDAIEPMPVIELNAQQESDVRLGRKIQMRQNLDVALSALARPGGEVFSVARQIGDFLQPECVIPSESSHAIS